MESIIAIIVNCAIGAFLLLTVAMAIGPALIKNATTAQERHEAGVELD